MYRRERSTPHMQGDLGTRCVGPRKSAAGGVLAMLAGIAGVYPSRGMRREGQFATSRLARNRGGSHDEDT